MSNKNVSTNAKDEVEKVEKSVVMSNQFSSILSTLSSFRTQITMLQNQIRGLEKTVSREMKRQQKEVAKGKIREIESQVDLLFQRQFQMIYVILCKATGK